MKTTEEPSGSRSINNQAYDHHSYLSSSMAVPGAHEGYIMDIEEIREREYPLLKGDYNHLLNV